MKLSETAEAIFKEAVRSVHPENLIRNTVSISEKQLTIGEHRFSRASLNRIYVLGAGKAAAGMAQALEKVAGDLIHEGLIVVKYDHELPLRKIKQLSAAHPVPDQNGAVAAAKIHQMLQNTTANDLVICLWSGGASALLADCPEIISLNDLQTVSDRLLRSGAAITEINTVRKHLSTLKGGQLARLASPASLLSLIISDVVGDDPAVIASGPAVPDPSTFQDAIEVLDRYFPAGEPAPRTVRDYLEKGLAGQLPETPKPGDPLFRNVNHLIIGSNEVALSAAARKALQAGFFVKLLGARAEGPAEDVASFLVNQAKTHTGPFPVCFLLGGESTVEVRGDGTGGRNQHLALAAALKLEQAGLPGAVVLSAGTDGTDGPTDQAGAVADVGTLQKARSMNRSPEEFLARCDSFHFFEQVGGHVHTGPTQTNVMDLMLVLVPGN